MVIVFHPGLQHSHQLARALFEKGMLRKFISGVPVSPRKYLFIPRKYVKDAGISDDRLLSFFFFPIIRNLSGKIFGFRFEKNVTFVFDLLFDAICALLVACYRPRSIVGYQNASLLTFKMAEFLGIERVLDCASVHHSNITIAEHDFIRLVRWRKTREIDLADRLICCSEMARQTYLAAGVPPEKISVLHLGAELSSAIPRQYERSLDDELVITYVGSISCAKGLDVVHEALGACRFRHRIPVRLNLAGRIADDDFAALIERSDWITYHGYLSREECDRLFQASDLAILMSRYDSFGMVVVEAMSNAVPVIVSEHVGAAEVITVHPQAGWILPLGADHLEELVCEIHRGKYSLVRYSAVACEAAKMYSWEMYRAACANALKSHGGDF